MLTKIKNALSKISKFEWVVLGIAVLALVLALAPKGGHGGKGQHGGNKGQEKASVETVEVK